MLYRESKRPWGGKGMWFESNSVAQVVQYIELSGQSLLLLDLFRFT